MQFFVWTLCKSHSLTFYILWSFYPITHPTWVGFWTPTPLLKKGTNLLTPRRWLFFCLFFLSSYETYYCFFFPGNSCSVWEQKERKWQVHNQQVINYFPWFCFFFSFFFLLHFIIQHPFLSYTYAITKIVIF